MMWNVMDHYDPREHLDKGYTEQRTDARGRGDHRKFRPPAFAAAAAPDFLGTVAGGHLTAGNPFLRRGMAEHEINYFDHFGAFIHQELCRLSAENAFLQTLVGDGSKAFVFHSIRASQLLTLQEQTRHNVKANSVQDNRNPKSVKEYIMPDAIPFLELIKAVSAHAGQIHTPVGLAEYLKLYDKGETPEHYIKLPAQYIVDVINMVRSDEELEHALIEQNIYSEQHLAGPSDPNVVGARTFKWHGEGGLSNVDVRVDEKRVFVVTPRGEWMTINAPNAAASKGMHDAVRKKIKLVYRTGVVMEEDEPTLDGDSVQLAVEVSLGRPRTAEGVPDGNRGSVVTFVDFGKLENDKFVSDVVYEEAMVEIPTKGGGVRKRTINRPVADENTHIYIDSAFFVPFDLFYLAQMQVNPDAAEGDENLDPPPPAHDSDDDHACDTDEATYVIEFQGKEAERCIGYTCHMKPGKKSRDDPNPPAIAIRLFNFSIVNCVVIKDAQTLYPETKRSCYVTVECVVHNFDAPDHSEVYYVPGKPVPSDVRRVVYPITLQPDDLSSVSGHPKYFHKPFSDQSGTRLKFDAACKLDHLKQCLQQVMEVYSKEHSSRVCISYFGQQRSTAGLKNPAEKYYLDGWGNAFKNGLPYKQNTKEVPVSYDETVMKERPGQRLAHLGPEYVPKFFTAPGADWWEPAWWSQCVMLKLFLLTTLPKWFQNNLQVMYMALALALIFTKASEIKDMELFIKQIPTGILYSPMGKTGKTWCLTILAALFMTNGGHTISGMRSTIVFLYAMLDHYANLPILVDELTPVYKAEDKTNTYDPKTAEAIFGAAEQETRGVAGHVDHVKTGFLYGTNVLTNLKNMPLMERTIKLRWHPFDGKKGSFYYSPTGGNEWKGLMKAASFLLPALENFRWDGKLDRAYVRDCMEFVIICSAGRYHEGDRESCHLGLMMYIRLYMSAICGEPIEKREDTFKWFAETLLQTAQEADKRAADPAVNFVCAIKEAIAIGCCKDGADKMIYFHNMLEVSETGKIWQDPTGPLSDLMPAVEKWIALDIEHIIKVLNQRMSNGERSSKMAVKEVQDALKVHGAFELAVGGCGNSRGQSHRPTARPSKHNGVAFMKADGFPLLFKSEGITNNDVQEVDKVRYEQSEFMTKVDDEGKPLHEKFAGQPKKCYLIKASVFEELYESTQISPDQIVDYKKVMVHEMDSSLKDTHVEDHDGEVYNLYEAVCVKPKEEGVEWTGLRAAMANPVYYWQWGPTRLLTDKPKAWAVALARELLPVSHLNDADAVMEFFQWSTFAEYNSQPLHLRPRVYQQNPWWRAHEIQDAMMEDLDDESWEGSFAGSSPGSSEKPGSSEESPQKKQKRPTSLVSLFDGPTAFEQSQAQQEAPARTVSPQWQVDERLNSPTPSERMAQDLMDEEEVAALCQDYF